MVFIICSVITLYIVYQMVRNEVIFKIRMNWTDTRDKRWYKYSYGYMLDPRKHNWYGLKYPRDNHFKSDLLNELKEEK